MVDRFAALAAALLVALLAAVPMLQEGRPAGAGSSTVPETQVMGGRSIVPDLGHDRVPLPSRAPAGTPLPTSVATPAPPVIDGTASNYPGTAGYIGQPVIALPGAMGGRYTGEVQGYATVCADRCARMAVVDWCQCYWGTSDQRVVDISHAAWPLISDQPLSRGLIEVRVVLNDPQLAAVWRS